MAQLWQARLVQDSPDQVLMNGRRSMSQTHSSHTQCDDVHPAVLEASLATRAKPTPRPPTFRIAVFYPHDDRPSKDTRFSQDKESIESYVPQSCGLPSGEGWHLGLPPSSDPLWCPSPRTSSARLILLRW
ncbi:hypothetical protein C8Q80DRAFT_762308 [Daedaleopsis nitida]|nr:hypothetical protein C8Q80DRAFT_762308 [Daedaleopsis nitida]